LRKFEGEQRRRLLPAKYANNTESKFGRRISRGFVYLAGNFLIRTFVQSQVEQRWTKKTACNSQQKTINL